jgi:TPR repeat protein
MKKIVLSLACAISFSFATAPEEKLQEQKDKEIERVIKTYDELASKYYELNPSILAFKHLYAIDDKELTVEDMLIIGNKYYFKDTYTDYQKAMEWYKKVAEESYEVDYVIADMYRNGMGVYKSDTEAFDWYERIEILGVKEDSESIALEWWENNPNHPHYEFNTGLIYYNISENYKKALELFEKADNKKDTYAQYYLGVMHKNGQGVDKNDKKAKEYFKKSCDAKLEKACDELKKLK